jgi:hypothetical protein
MNYLKVKWKHSFSDEPVLLYSELDDARWELRKVEVFPDGKMGYAAAGKDSGGTKLTKEPLPSLAQIAFDTQFEPVVISGAEFESVWDEATAG